MKIQTFSHFDGGKSVDNKVKEDLFNLLEQLKYDVRPNCSKVFSKKNIQSAKNGWLVKQIST